MAYAFVPFACCLLGCNCSGRGRRRRRWPAIDRGDGGNSTRNPALCVAARKSESGMATAIVRVEFSRRTAWSTFQTTRDPSNKKGGNALGATVAAHSAEPPTSNITHVKEKYDNKNFFRKWSMNSDSLCNSPVSEQRPIKRTIDPSSCSGRCRRRRR